jgi:hypothetical protein
MEAAGNFKFRLHSRSIKKYNSNGCVSIIIRGQFDETTPSNSRLKAFGVMPHGALLAEIELGDLCPMPCDDQSTFTADTEYEEKANP